ncbi:MAG: cytochrome c-type biogenesis protein CcmH [Gemmatimonadaceae bacterium]
MILDRRGFLAALAAGAAGAGASGAVAAQGSQPSPTQGATGPMDEGAYRPVRLPAKAERVSMPDEARDDLERHLGCQCGCGLDIFICRTTHFTCAVSPAMHRDVMGLVAGGHSAREITDAFVGVYGERVLMSPRKAGFNWAGYLAPFVALGGGTLVVMTLIKRWGSARAAGAVVTAVPLRATAEEMSRLRAALRDDAP